MDTLSFQALYDVAGHPPVLYIGQSRSGNGAVVTWSGGSAYSIEVASAAGARRHHVATCPDPSQAQALAGRMIADL